MIRFSDTRGEMHRLSRVKREHVLEMRRRYEAGESVTRLAVEFHLSSRYVLKICRRQAWSWLT